MVPYLREHFDYRTACITMALLFIGITSVYSATLDAHAAETFHKQLLWVGVSVIAAIVVGLLPFRFLQFISYPAYFASILMLAAVLLIGRTVSGSTSWFNLGGLPVSTLGVRKDHHRSGSGNVHLPQRRFPAKTGHLATATGIVLLPVILILLQPDIGTVAHLRRNVFPDPLLGRRDAVCAARAQRPSRPSASPHCSGRRHF